MAENREKEEDKLNPDDTQFKFLNDIVNNKNWFTVALK